MNLRDKLRKDSFGLGVILGLALPIVLFAIMFGVLLIMVHVRPDMLMRSPDLYKNVVPKLILIAMLPSIFLMRHYLLNLKYDKTGRGILTATLILAVAFVVTQFAL